MSDPIRFDDLPPDEKISFLTRARESFADDPPEIEPGWACTNCGQSFPIDIVLVAGGEPHCPNCGASGWDQVAPRQVIEDRPPD
jgi:hypothetical protein